MLQIGSRQASQIDVLLTRSSSHHTVDMSRDRGSLKCRSHYMALSEWDLTDAQTWIYLYFSMFAPAVRPGTEACKPYILQYPILDLRQLRRLDGHRIGLRRFGLGGFPRGTDSLHTLIASSLYFRPPYPTSGGTQAAKQQDVCVEEYFCGGTVARGTFAFIDSVMD
ncbi:hypothetical protein M9H77_31582 [Catharanthus roseus]|uniref:Uncharacterized protein n=1 Tax=Catharanthus roseus TaxID=4058 RepID=A0ACC0A2C7_CATRO|nr:hypothetical protein M9H77_31582 [Catharanthus roseus]